MFYHHSTLGGTFDHLHIGHTTLIDRAFSESEKVSIGLSTEKLLKDKVLSRLIQEYSIREINLINYLKTKGYFSRAKIIPLFDFYGTTVKDETIEAVYVTEKTVANTVFINEARNKAGLRNLDINTIVMVKDDSGEDISSERIRLGEINSSGHAYITFFKDKNKLLLPDEMREKLRQPLGELVNGQEDDLLSTALVLKEKIEKTKPTLVASIGDTVTKSLLMAGRIPEIRMIDYKTKREPIQQKEVDFISLTDSEQASNDPGLFNPEVAYAYLRAVRKYFSDGKPQQVTIVGEEDLLALSAILLSPLDSVVLYGLFEKGVVFVKVDSKMKESAENILKKFK